MLEDWTQLSDDQLLNLRISQLRLTWQGTPLAPMVHQLHGELRQRGLSFMPPCHIGDEWFCPVGIPAIYIPFFLVHDRLRRLERRMMLEVEGETKSWFMKLMRHEAGHAYSYAYHLYKRKKWQEQFGLASQEETETYRPRPYSRSFVIHLDDWYAQSHPDEDFAETFAVWLTPHSNWRVKYQGWKALAKLEYVDQLMRSLAGRPPMHQPQYGPAEYSFLNIKLKTYYQRKRKKFAESYPDFYDKDLKALFAPASESSTLEPAARYLKRQRRSILAAVCQWTNERKYRVSQLLERLINRCSELNLEARGDAAALNLQIASYITCLVMNHLFTGRFKRTK